MGVSNLQTCRNRLDYGFCASSRGSDSSLAWQVLLAKWGVYEHSATAVCGHSMGRIFVESA
jgi:hypothetical protein